MHISSQSLIDPDLYTKLQISGMNKFMKINLTFTCADQFTYCCSEQVRLEYSSCAMKLAV